MRVHTAFIDLCFAFNELRFILLNATWHWVMNWQLLLMINLTIYSCSELYSYINLYCYKNEAISTCCPSWLLSLLHDLLMPYIVPLYLSLEEIAATRSLLQPIMYSLKCCTTSRSSFLSFSQSRCCIVTANCSCLIFRILLASTGYAPSQHARTCIRMCVPSKYWRLALPLWIITMTSCKWIIFVCRTNIHVKSCRDMYSRLLIWSKMNEVD